MPTCEVCGNLPATYFTTPYKELGLVWKMTCGICDRDSYWVPIDEYLNPYIGWRNHLEDKRWFVPEIFDAMIERM